MKNLKEKFKKMWLKAKRVGKNIMTASGRDLDEEIMKAEKKRMMKEKQMMMK